MTTQRIILIAGVILWALFWVTVAGAFELHTTALVIRTDKHRIADHKASDLYRGLTIGGGVYATLAEDVPLLKRVDIKVRGMYRATAVSWNNAKGRIDLKAKPAPWLEFGPTFGKEPRGVWVEYELKAVWHH